MAGFEAAAGGGSPGGAGSKHHRARQQSLGGGSRPEETVEAMCRPRAPLLRALQRLAAPFLTPVSASVQNVCNGSFMVGTMPVDISEVLQATNGTAQEAALNKICSEPELLRDFELTMFPAKQGFLLSSGGSFFKELLSRKTLPVEDLTSFSGDYDYPANTEILNRSWEEASSIVKYELALSRIEYEMVRHGLRGLKGPERLILRRLFYRRQVERDIRELKKRFGTMEKLFKKLDGSTAKGFEGLCQAFKELSLRNKQLIDEGLAEIEKASRKDQAAIDASFEELRANLSSFVKEEFAKFVNDAEKTSKNASGSLLEQLTWKVFLRYAFIACNLAVHIARFIHDQKPEPSPVPPGPVPPCPSPVQEELQPVLEPSVPTTPAFYKSIGRLNKGLLNKGFAMTPISTSRMKVPFGPDSKSYVSMVVCTGNSKVAAKVSCASLFEDKLRMTFLAGLGDFKPKAKLFYSFPFAGVNGALNASVVCGDSPDLKLALTLEKQGLVAGGKVLLDPLTKKLKHHEVGLSYGPGALKLLDCDRLKLSLYDGGLSQVVAGGLELTYLRSKEEATVCAAVCAKLGDSTTVKAKVDTAGAVSAAVRHRLADDFEAGACVRVQLGKVSRFGFSISSRF